MDDKNRVEVQLTDTTYKKWQQYIDESPTIVYMSQLIRTAVDDYITRQNTPTEATGADHKDQLTDIHHDIKQIQDTLTLIRTETPNTEDLDQILYNTLADYYSDTSTGFMTAAELETVEKLTEQLNDDN